MEDLRQRLYQEIFTELPLLAIQQQWAVTANHCIGRIVYDCVMQTKWSNLVQSPFYKNAELSKVVAALLICDRLRSEGKSLADKLNQQSLEYRR